MLRLLRIALRALVLAAVRRLRMGPSAPSWSWTLELLVAVYRDGLTDTMRLPPARARALTIRPPGRVPGISFARVDLGGIAALRIEPAARPAASSLLYIHGGGFVIGSPQTHLHLTSSLCAGSEARVWSLDYRLAPEHPFPAAPDDVLTAYRALLEQGVDPARLAVAGDSAGGTLALVLLSQLRERGLPLPAGAVLISPAPDLALAGASWTSNARTDWLTHALAEHWISLYVQGRDRRDPAISPIHADLRGLPPLLVQVGSAECLRDDVLQLAAKLERADVPVTLSEYADMPHVWHLFRTLLPEARRALDEISAFLRAHGGEPGGRYRQG